MPPKKTSKASTSIEPAHEADAHLVFKDGAVLRKAFEALKELTQFITIDFESGSTRPYMSVQATDSSNVCLVSLCLPAQGVVRKSTSVGIDLSMLTRTLKFMATDDKVEFIAGQPSGKMTVIIASMSMSRASNFELSLMELDSGRFNIPDQDYDAVVEMSSAEYIRVFRDLSTIGSDVAVECKDGEFHLTSSGTLGTATVKYCDDKDASGVRIVDARCNAKLCLSLKYMNSFGKACGIAPACRISIMHEHPVKVQFDVSESLGDDGDDDEIKGRLQFFLAPRVEDDDEDGDNHNDDEDGVDA